jgi:hypothetical protein
MRRTKPFLLLLVLMSIMSACSAPATEITSTLAPVTTTLAPTQVTPTQIAESVSTQLPGTVPLTEAEVPRVTVEQAKEAFDRGEAIIVDVRSTDAYAVSHVAGAINIELGEFETNPTSLNLDKNKWIITYCT